MTRKFQTLIPLCICLIASFFSLIMIITGAVGEMETWRLIFSSVGFIGILFLTIWFGKRILN